MTVIKYENGGNGIYNESGLQVKGTNAINLDGLNPKELIEGAVALCLSLTLTEILKRDSLATDDMAFDITVTAHKHESANRIARLEVQMGFPEHLEAEYIEKIMPKVKRGCTIGNSLEAGVEIVLAGKSAEE